MIYTLCRTERASDLSAGIEQLRRPPHLRKPGELPVWWCAWHVHPQTPEWCVLEIPEQETIPIHVEADGALLAQTLAVFVADGAMTQDEFDSLVATVPMLAGQTVRVADLIPASWAQYTFDRATAAAQGFFPSEAE